MKFPLIVVFTAAALAGCASSVRPGPSRPSAEPRPATPNVVRPRPSPGDLVIGRNAAALVALFGDPALDVQEGSARKLQFLGPTCVLDAYLYPPQARGEPVVTHVDARLRDGRDTDRAACVQTLRRR
jgi:hypothetical protein